MEFSVVHDTVSSSKTPVKYEELVAVTTHMKYSLSSRKTTSPCSTNTSIPDKHSDQRNYYTNKQPPAYKNAA
jgi:hypothetical protein